MPATVGASTDGARAPGSVVEDEGGSARSVDRSAPLWAHLLWAVMGLGSLAAVAVRWVDRPLPIVIPAVQSLTPYLLVGAIVLTAIAAWRGRHALACCAPAAVAALLVIGQFGLRWAAAPGVPEAPVGSLRVMTLNVEYGGADPAATMEQIRRHDVDVVVLLESDPQHLGTLDDAGLADTYPHRTSTPVSDGPAGSVIVSRLPITPLQTPLYTEARTFEQPAVVVQTTGGAVTVRAVHPYPPVPARTEAWRAGLHAMRDWANARDDERLVLAGDFNAAAGHPPFRAFLTDFVDAAEATGTVLPRTWPVGHRRLPPFVAIDHVLTRGMAARDLEIIHVPDTDHAGLVADLAW